MTSNKTLRTLFATLNEELKTNPLPKGDKDDIMPTKELQFLLDKIIAEPVIAAAKKQGIDITCQFFNYASVAREDNRTLSMYIAPAGKATKAKLDELRLYSQSKEVLLASLDLSDGGKGSHYVGASVTYDTDRYDLIDMPLEEAIERLDARNKKEAQHILDTLAFIDTALANKSDDEIKLMVDTFYLLLKTQRNYEEPSFTELVDIAMTTSKAVDVIGGEKQATQFFEAFDAARDFICTTMDEDGEELPVEVFLLDAKWRKQVEELYS